MAFATSTLVNGEWTTRTLDVDTVLRHYNQKDKDSIDTSSLFQPEIIPKLGLLTQTVTPSSLVHWILAARLRDLNTQDVVFIGDDFVQVRELRADGNLHDVIRKDNFGSRIRNARIVGSIKAFEDDPEAQLDDIQFKDEEDDFYMEPSVMNQHAIGSTKRQILPPQVILLQFSSGDSVFLRLCESENGSLEFTSSHRRVSKSMVKLQPGMHLTVDPSSRYAALGCSEGVVAIYELHSRNELKAQYALSPNLQYVASEFHLFLSGAILKVEFLHPAQDDDEHIILIVLLAAKGKTRMMLFEWETGGPMSKIRPHTPKGHLLDTNRQLPLLLIPLTIKSSFILVCENSMSVCLGILHGSPTFIDFNDRIDPPTEFHNGLGNPLWTSWTRALRFPSRAATIDDIFVVREDGLIKLLELDCTLDEIVKSDNNIGEFGVSCGTALACLYVELGDSTKSGDMFVIGGDACTGGTYLLAARRNPILLEPIPNWSPAHDLITTHPPPNLDANLGGNSSSNNGNVVTQPDRIFACVGKGINGAVVEFRQGLEAKIGLEMDCETPVIQSWVFDDFTIGANSCQDASLFLLSLGDRSKLLRLISHPAEIEELDETQTKFDLRDRTIAAATHKDQFVQVTEKSITIGNGSTVRRLEGAELLSIDQRDSIGSEMTIYNAAINQNSAVFTTKLNNLVYLQVLRAEEVQGAMEMNENSAASSKPNIRTISQYSSHITCLAMCMVDNINCAIVAQLEGDLITLDVKPLQEDNLLTFKIPTNGTLSKGLKLDAIASISIQQSQHGTLQMLCGTHNGILIALELDLRTKELIAFHASRIGATSIKIFEDQHSVYGFLAICDSKLFALKPRLTPPRRRITKNWAYSFEIRRFWLTDTLRPDMEQPRLTSIASQPPSQLVSNTRDLLLTAGSQIIVASLNPEVKSIPRHIRVGGTPSRLLYSRSLEALIVATSLKGKSTLLFLDPETGANLSQPVDQRTKEPVDFVSGLGNSNERVFRLFEWAFTKDGKTWNFIIVSTSTGRLLIISVDNHERIRKDIQNALFRVNDRGDGGRRSKISYYTRYKFKSNEPVYSVAGYSDGLIWCSGDKLYCDALDLTAKRFKRITEYVLPSPAINLSHDKGVISALTLNHSLEILQLTLNEAGETQIIRTHGDQVTRPSLHHVACSQSSARPIHLVSDKNNSLVGLWPTQNTKADTLDTVFEAQLSSSVLRFCFARCRPSWDSVWITKQGRRYSGGALQLENVPSLTSHTEIIGLSVTGALSHYTILDFQTWKFLRFLTDLAIRSSKVCEFTQYNDTVPLQTFWFPKTMMHIDGDILRRCLEEGLLETLLCVLEDRIQSPEIFKRFCELLQDLHQGTLIDGGNPSVYIDQAYKDLEFFLRPVL